MPERTCSAISRTARTLRDTSPGQRVADDRRRQQVGDLGGNGSSCGVNGGLLDPIGAKPCSGGLPGTYCPSGSNPVDFGASCVWGSPCGDPLELDANDFTGPPKTHSWSPGACAARHNDGHSTDLVTPDQERVSERNQIVERPDLPVVSMA